MTRAGGGESLSGNGHRGTWARWGWPATTLALGLALISSAASNYRSAVNASDAVVRAHAEVLREAIFGGMRDVRWQYPASLDSAVAAQAEAGLRYAAFIDVGGRVVTSGGTPSEPAPAIGSEMRSPQFARLGPRVRAIFPPPPRRLEHRDGPSSGPPRLVIEFEPLVAREMVSRAMRSLIIALVVAAVLMAAGLASWRLSQRMEREERRLEEQRRLTQLGEMSAVLAHEIRNPLASLKGHAQLLTERLPADSAERRRADRVVEEATRLEALTSDLLDFARSGPMDLRSIDPAALLRTAVAQVPEMSIAIDAAHAPGRWLLDERRFGQGVLVNLLRNAVQASPADRPPLARVALENDRLVFTVRDFGAGLAEGSEKRIFDPFFTTNTKGTGLGLAVASRIVEMHGGHIEAGNAPDGGALFRVELPGQGS